MDHQLALHMLREIAAGFNRHDLDAIMQFHRPDAVFEGPRGPDPWGRRYVGADQIRAAFAARFEGIPNVRYGQDQHFVDGDRGASEWRLSGTTVDGQQLDLNGCDLWVFQDGKVVKKDSYWKIVTDGG